MIGGGASSQTEMGKKEKKHQILQAGLFSSQYTPSKGSWTSKNTLSFKVVPFQNFNLDNHYQFNYHREYSFQSFIRDYSLAVSANYIQPKFTLGFECNHSGYFDSKYLSDKLSTVFSPYFQISLYPNLKLNFSPSLSFSSNLYPEEGIIYREGFQPIMSYEYGQAVRFEVEETEEYEIWVELHFSDFPSEKIPYLAEEIKEIDTSTKFELTSDYLFQLSKLYLSQREIELRKFKFYPFPESISLFSGRKYWLIFPKTPSRCYATRKGPAPLPKGVYAQRKRNNQKWEVVPGYLNLKVIKQGNPSNENRNYTFSSSLSYSAGEKVALNIGYTGGGSSARYLEPGITQETGQARDGTFNFGVQYQIKENIKTSLNLRKNLVRDDYLKGKGKRERKTQASENIDFSFNWANTSLSLNYTNAGYQYALEKTLNSNYQTFNFKFTTEYTFKNFKLGVTQESTFKVDYFPHKLKAEPWEKKLFVRSLNFSPRISWEKKFPEGRKIKNINLDWSHYGSIDGYYYKIPPEQVERGDTREFIKEVEKLNLKITFPSGNILDFLLLGELFHTKYEDKEYTAQNSRDLSLTSHLAWDGKLTPTLGLSLTEKILFSKVKEDFADRGSSVINHTFNGSFNKNLSPHQNIGISYQFTDIHAFSRTQGSSARDSERIIHTPGVIYSFTSGHRRVNLHYQYHYERVYSFQEEQKKWGVSEVDYYHQLTLSGEIKIFKGLSFTLTGSSIFNSKEKLRNTLSAVFSLKYRFGAPAEKDEKDEEAGNN
jgi:hypothetical protein